MNYTPRERLKALLSRSAQDEDCRLTGEELESYTAWLEDYTDALPPELSQKIWSLPTVAAAHYCRILEFACRHMVFPEELPER